MRKYTISYDIALCCAILISCTTIYAIEKTNPKEKELNSSFNKSPLSLIVDEQKKPTKPILELLALCKIEHNGTFTDIVEKTQRFFLRKPGQERWHIHNTHTTNLETFSTLFHQLNLIDNIRPKHQQYDCIVILGASLKHLRRRFAYVLDLYKQGIRFNKMVFLVGQRPTDTSIETREHILNPQSEGLTLKATWHLKNMPKTETDIARLIVEQTAVPAEFAQIPVLFIDTPMNIGIDGSLKRPTTGDTIKEWLATRPQPGTYLFVSSQPNVGYQDAVIQTYIEKEFAFETVGCSMEAHEIKNTDLILDTIARWLYQTEQLNKN